MQQAATFSRSAPRWPVLAAIFLAHVLAVLCWPAREPHDAGPPSKVMQLLVIGPKAKAPPAKASRRPATSAPRPQRARPLVPEAVAVTPPLSVPAPVPTPVDAITPPLVDTLAARARRDVGAIDKQLRMASPDPAQRKLAHDQTPLARAMESAFIPRGPEKTVSLILPDGSHVTKKGDKCRMVEDNHTIMSETRRRQGFTVKRIECPKS